MFRTLPSRRIVAKSFDPYIYLVSTSSEEKVRESECPVLTGALLRRQKQMWSPILRCNCLFPGYVCTPMFVFMVSGGCGLNSPNTLRDVKCICILRCAPIDRKSVV